MDTQKSKIHILLVGGGTGGHFYPLVSVAESLNESPLRPQLYYAGPDRYDAGALLTERISYLSVGAGKQRRYASIKNFFDVFITLWGTCVAVCKLLFIYPDVILSKGGYTSVPVILAGAFLRIPIVVHESDAVIGRANKIGARFARTVITAYAETKAMVAHTDVQTLGIPIRKVLRSAPADDPCGALGISSDRPVILVLGGSQGAERINQFVLDALDELLKEYTIIHQTGVKNLEMSTLAAEQFIPDENMRAHYHPIGFLDAPMLNNAYHCASIVLSRAGSNSIYEIALHGKPAILIPIPEEISHDQRTNAYTYARSGGAVVMEEHNLTDNLLQAEIDRIMQNKEVYTGMAEQAKAFGKTDTADNLAHLLLDISQEHIR